MSEKLKAQSLMASLFCVLKVTLAWLFAILFWLPVSLIHLVLLKKTPERIILPAMRFWGQATLALLSVKLKLMNSSTLNDRRARVVVCNHQSSLDVMWMAAITPPAVVSIAKKEIIYIPIVNLVWSVFDFVRIDRSNVSSAIAKMKGIADDLVRNSRSLLIAPEGTRSPDGKIQSFKKGAFHIALKKKIPIYPVVVSGAFECYPKQAMLPRAGQILVEFLPPIDTSSYSTDNIDKLIEETRNKMLEVYERLSRIN